MDNYLSVRGLSPSKTGLTLKQAQLCVASAWILAVVHMIATMFPTFKSINVDSEYDICTVFHFPNSNTMMLSLGVAFLIMLVVIICFMTLSLRAVNRSTKNLFQTEGANSAQNEFRQRSMKRKAKIAQIFAIIAIGYVVSYMPVCLTSIVYTTCNCIASSAIGATISVTPLNACFNILVYVMKDHTFRGDVLRILKCRRNQVNPEDPVNTVNTIVS
jgi:hypothetical protein